MTTTNFVNGTTLSDDDWFNDVNRLHYTILGDPADAAAVVAALKASQAQQETGTSNAVVVTPGTQKFHLSAAKAWAQWDLTGALSASYNINSVTDSGVGAFIINFATAFSSANYAVLISTQDSNPPVIGGTGSKTTTTCAINFRDVNGMLADSAGSFYAAFYGDQ